MTPKNTICLWFNKDAHEAARFYAATFPDSKVTAVHKAPGDYPGGKEGDVLTVEFTVLGIPCLGLNGGPEFKHSEAFSFQIATDSQEETDRYWNAIVGNGGKESAVRLVQGPLGPVLADHPARTNRCYGGRWRRGKACLRSDDADEEDRHRHDRGGAAGLTWTRRLRRESPRTRPAPTARSTRGFARSRERAAGSRCWRMRSAAPIPRRPSGPAADASTRHRRPTKDRAGIHEPEWVVEIPVDVPAGLAGGSVASRIPGCSVCIRAAAASRDCPGFRRTNT